MKIYIKYNDTELALCIDDLENIHDLDKFINYRRCF